MKELPLVILLAEDNIDHAELIIESFKGFNEKNTIFHASNGEAALKLLTNSLSAGEKSIKPDLIILDLKMNRLDGKSTLKAIRTNQATQYLPVIMISTSCSEQDVNDCYQLGANSYVSKPIDYDCFVKKIHNLNHYWALTSELPN